MKQISEKSLTGNYLFPHHPYIEKKFQQNFETTNDLIFIVNKSGKIKKTNPAVEIRLGYKQKELKNSFLVDLYPPRIHKKFLFCFNKILNDKLCFHSLPLFTKEGEEVSVETCIIQGQWHNTDIFYSISHDISHLIDPSKDFYTKKSRFHLIFDSFGDGIWDWHIPSGEITYNRHCLTILGYNREEIFNTDKSWKTLIHPHDYKNVIVELKKYINGEIPYFKKEYRMICKNGNYIWIINKGKITSKDNNGNPEHMMGIITDITNHKNFEKSLLTTLKKEQELNNLKSQFVSMASHEIRTPLASILIAADSLDAYWKRMPENEIKQNIKNIKKNVIFLKNTVNKVLDLSHIESGQIELTTEQTELNTFLSKFIENTKQYQEIKHPITFYKTRMPIFCQIDRHIIKEVLINIITNSIKYSPQNTPIEIAIYKNRKNIIIKISDKGFGIPENDKKNIFTPFKRGSNILNIRGTGLGLPLSKKFIKKHGGELLFKSRINHGTSFFICLPV